VTEGRPSTFRLEATSQCFDAAITAGRGAVRSRALVAEIVVDDRVGLPARVSATVAPGMTLAVQRRRDFGSDR